MKAILLAGGKGTRLRPLTIHTPKPIVPIFDRPFLHYQLDLLKQVPEIDEVILSLNYQPRRIEEMFGDGGESGLAIRYVVEPAPLGTAGAVRYAGESLRESVVVFNGDVLTEIDLAAVIRLHRERNAKATIVLTPVENPSAYGLVETDASVWISPEARVEEGVAIEGPCFIDAGTVVKTGARIGPYTVVGRQCRIEEHAMLDRAIVWPNTRISQEAVIRDSILGRHCHVG